MNFTEQEKRTLIQICRKVFDDKMRHIDHMNRLAQKDDATEEDIEWAKDFIERDKQRMEMMNEIVRKLEAK